jgi:hypothetical protein
MSAPLRARSRRVDVFGGVWSVWMVRIASRYRGCPNGRAWSLWWWEQCVVGRSSGGDRR